MVQLENVSVSFGGNPLFRNVSWRVGDRDRVGLIGPNGSGKTTILRLINGDLSPEEGRVACSKGCTFGFLPQEQLVLSGRSLFDEAVTVFESLKRTEERLRALEHRMAELPEKDPQHDDVMREYAKLHDAFVAQDGFSLEARVAEVLAGLGFTDADFSRMTDEFSGGWQMRIALAKLLLERPTVLLLDEPTNHLDLESMVWLEGYLAGYPGAVIMVSHDRAFIDTIVSRVSELDSEGLVDYHGDYESYQKERSRRREALAAKRRQQEQRIAQIQKFIDKHRSNAATAPMVQSRIKMLEKIELVKIPTDRRGVRFRFPQPERGGAVTVALEGARKSYGDNVVFDGVDFEARRGDKIALVGVNGAGKSTLLKMIAGLTELHGGSRKLGHNVSIQYFGQEPWRTLTPTNTVLEELQSVSPDEMRPRLRSLLGSMLFTGDDVEKGVGILSGGEKCRLAIAKMLVRPANFLLLDEPTNHLDVSSREVLEDALSQYTGTICFVSHDRRFMDHLANTVLEVADGRLRFHLGNYGEYLRTKRRQGEGGAGGGEAGSASRGAGSEATARGSGAGRADTGAKPRAARTESADERSRSRARRKTKEDRRREAEERQRLATAKRSRRERRRAVLDEIAQGETRLEEISVSLADPTVYKDGEKMRLVVNEQRELRSRMDELYLLWEDLED